MQIPINTRKQSFSGTLKAQSLRLAGRRVMAVAMPAGSMSGAFSLTDGHTSAVLTSMQVRGVPSFLLVLAQDSFTLHSGWSGLTL